MRDGNVLYLNGNSDWRNLNRNTVKSNWNRNFVVGFLSQSLHSLVLVAGVCFLSRFKFSYPSA